MPDKTLFYSVCVVNDASRERGSPWAWSAPFDTASEAKKEARRRVNAGEATVGFVVAVGPTGRSVLADFTQPESARKLLRHYFDLLARLADDAPQ